MCAALHKHAGRPTPESIEQHSARTRAGDVHSPSARSSHDYGTPRPSSSHAHDREEAPASPQSPVDHSFVHHTPVQSAGWLSGAAGRMAAISSPRSRMDVMEVCCVRVCVCLRGYVCLQEVIALPIPYRCCETHSVKRHWCVIGSSLHAQEHRVASFIA